MSILSAIGNLLPHNTTVEVNNAPIPSSDGVTLNPARSPLATPPPGVISPKQGYNISPDQKNKAIATVLAEAQAEGTPGMQAVLNVINNRIGTPSLSGGTRANIFDVVSEPKQFSAFNNKNPIYTKYRDFLRGKPVSLTPEEKSKLAGVQKLFDIASQGKLQDLTNGANQYYNPTLAQPAWAKSLKNPQKIGSHVFGTL